MSRTKVERYGARKAKRQQMLALRWKAKWQQMLAQLMKVVTGMWPYLRHHLDAVVAASCQTVSSQVWPRDLKGLAP